MTKKKTVPADKKKTAKKIKAKKQVRKPDFENALNEVALGEQTNDQAQDGVKRPSSIRQDSGAGDNLDRLDRSKAPQALAPVLKIPFSIWASVSEIPEMKLSDDEAEEWAEPMVALLEYYFPGKIPEIAWIWLMFLSSTEKVIDSRVKIRYEKRQERERSHSVPVGPGEPVAASQPAPRRDGAEPTTEYPQG